MTDRRFSFIVNTVFFLLLASVFYVSMKYLLPLILPFIIAFGVSALLQRPITLLSQRFVRIPRKLTAALVIAVFLATVGTAAVLAAGGIWGELSDFLNNVPAMLSAAAERLSSGTSPAAGIIDRLPAPLQKYALALYQRVSDDIPGLLLGAAEGLSGLLIDSFGAIGSFAMKLPSVAITLLTTVISIFFIGLDHCGTKQAIASLLPSRLKTQAVKIKKCSSDTVISLCRTYLFLMLLTFSELAAGFALFNLLGADIIYPVALALLIALVDILPVLGVGTVLLPWAAADFISGAPARGVMILILYAVIVLVRNFLEPRLIGQRFGLHPALTLAAIYSGGKLFGFVGVFLFPLTLIVAKRLRDTGVFSSARERIQA